MGLTQVLRQVVYIQKNYQFLYANEIDINTVDYSGKTPLECAKESGYVDVVQWIRTIYPFKSELKKGSLISKSGQSKIVKVYPQIKKKTLIEAARTGDTILALKIIREGIPVNIANEDGITPLIAASANHHLELATLLIAEGAEINFCASEHNALTVSASRGNLEIIKLLLAKGANSNVGVNQTNALHFAAKKHFLEICEVLLENGANINAQTDDGKTPLILAVQGDSKAVVKLLLSKNADTELMDYNGGTALAHALRFNSRIESLQLLIEHGVNTNIYINEFKLTALHFAASSGNLNAVKYLLSKGANPNLKDSNGEDAITIAIKDGYPEIAEVLKLAMDDNSAKHREP